MRRFGSRFLHAAGFSDRQDERYGEEERAGSAQILIFRPGSYEDAREIALSLEQDKQVVVDFGGLEQELVRKISDFMDGAVYALRGQVHEISPTLLSAVPEYVDVEKEAGQPAGFGL